MNQYPMTVEGEKALRAELNKLKSEDRPRIIAAISDAREHGDLKENAEYHAAREQQGFCEGRIQELEGKLANSRVIDIKSIPAGDKVLFGVTVTLVNIETDEKVTYKIVGEDEANIKLNKVSITSPVARALIGKSVGDEVVVKTPGGEVEYEIDDVQHI